MKVILKKLTLVNFKGVKNKEFVFDRNETFIFGTNGTGKTTIEDGWLWLISGKDSTGAQKFGIKPVDINGNKVDKLNNEVSAVLEVDGEEIFIKKVNVENWVKPRGQAIEVYKGNDIEYYWGHANEVGMTEYKKRMSEIIPEEKLRLLSNVHYFHNLEWKDRRNILVGMAGDIDEAALINSKPSFLAIQDILSNPRKMADFKKSNNKSILEKKKQLAELYPKIEERKRDMGGLQRPFERLRKDLAAMENEVAKLDQAINDRNVAYQQEEEKITAKRREKFALTTTAGNISDALRTVIVAQRNKPDEVLDGLNKNIEVNSKTLSELGNEIKALETRINNGVTVIANIKSKIDTAEARVVDYRNKWGVENAKTLVFNPEEFCCPTCKRGYEPGDVTKRQEDLTTNFNLDKVATLKRFKDESDLVKQEIIASKGELETAESTLEKYRLDKSEKEHSYSKVENAIASDRTLIDQRKATPATEVKSIDELLADELSKHQEYQDLKKSIKVLEAATADFKPVDNSDLIKLKRDIQVKIDEIKADLINETHIKNNLERINQLEAEVTELSQQIADLEKKEFTVKEYERVKMNEVETRVNGMFSLVKFKMFKTLENGEIDDWCQTIVDGKSLEEGQLNQALVLNAGLDIINTVSKKYNIILPIMVDGRESVVELMETESQLINMIVSAPDKVLRIEPSYKADPSPATLFETA